MDYYNRYLERIEKLEKKLEGKTLIGTCGDCKYWEKTTNIPEVKKIYGICHSKEAKEDFWAGIEPPSTSGCRYWKEKKND